MKRFITNLFKLEKKPVKGLMAYEWVVMAYLVLTLIITFFMYTSINNPQAMIYGRIRIVALTAVMWLVYRIAPCRLTRFTRVGVQMALLAWWYPDTYEINRHLPNLDHLAATWEQSLFGCQPALLLRLALQGVQSCCLRHSLFVLYLLCCIHLPTGRWSYILL